MTLTRTLTVLLLLTQMLGLCILNGCAARGTASDASHGAFGASGSRGGVLRVEDRTRDTPTAQRLTAQAVGLIEENRLEEAMIKLDEALQADVMYGPARNNRGKVLFLNGDLYASAWEFQYAAQLMPHQPEPKNNLGLVMEAAGRLNDAVDHYTSAYDLARDNPEIIANLARARIRNGDQGAETRALLEELVLRDNRDEWLEWARRKLSVMQHRE